MFSEVSSFQRVERMVLGVGKGVLFREVSSFQEFPHREREVSLHTLTLVCRSSRV